jgi:hypothetical protein
MLPHDGDPHCTWATSRDAPICSIAPESPE